MLFVCLSVRLGHCSYEGIIVYRSLFELGSFPVHFEGGAVALVAPSFRLRDRQVQTLSGPRDPTRRESDASRICQVSEQNFLNDTIP